MSTLIHHVWSLPPSDIHVQSHCHLDLPAVQVVYIGGHTPVKIFFRLRLQNISPGVYPPMVADGGWLAVVLCCVCLRVMAMVSMSACCSKGGGYGFNVGALL